jgi:hypothetical protein
MAMLTRDARKKAIHTERDGFLASLWKHCELIVHVLGGRGKLHLMRLSYQRASATLGEDPGRMFRCFQRRHQPR